MTPAKVEELFACDSNASKAIALAIDLQWLTLLRSIELSVVGQRDLLT
jgi:hypothetical protein